MFVLSSRLAAARKAPRRDDGSRRQSEKWRGIYARASSSLTDAARITRFQVNALRSSGWQTMPLEKLLQARPGDYADRITSWLLCRARSACPSRSWSLRKGRPWSLSSSLSWSVRSRVAPGAFVRAAPGAFVRAAPGAFVRAAPGWMPSAFVRGAPGAFVRASPAWPPSAFMRGAPGGSSEGGSRLDAERVGAWRTRDAGTAPRYGG